MDLRKQLYQLYDSGGVGFDLALDMEKAQTIPSSHSYQCRLHTVLSSSSYLLVISVCVRSQGCVGRGVRVECEQEGRQRRAGRLPGYAHLQKTTDICAYVHTFCHTKTPDVLRVR